MVNLELAAASDTYQSPGVRFGQSVGLYIHDRTPRRQIAFLLLEVKMEDLGKTEQLRRPRQLKYALNRRKLGIGKLTRRKNQTATGDPSFLPKQSGNTGEGILTGIPSIGVDFGIKAA